MRLQALPILLSCLLVCPIAKAHVIEQIEAEAKETFARESNTEETVQFFAIHCHSREMTLEGTLSARFPMKKPKMKPGSAATEKAVGWFVLNDSLGSRTIEAEGQLLYGFSIKLGKIVHFEGTRVRGAEIVEILLSGTSHPSPVGSTMVHESGETTPMRCTASPRS